MAAASSATSALPSPCPPGNRWAHLCVENATPVATQVPNILETMKWAKAASARLADEGIDSRAAMIDLFSNKTLTSSEAFAGIGSG
eukprot:11194318-Alexandrium_andersonii.AAC.1